MEQKKDNRGGVRPGAGRPRKDEEQSIINLLDKHIDREVVTLELLKRIKQGDMKAITLYYSYMFGKPLQTINQTTQLSVNDIDISDLISFKKSNDNE